jgi:hypothetical protein
MSITPWKSEIDAIDAARRMVHPSEDPGYVLADRVGRVAHAEQCCLWHASHLVVLARYASGEIPTAVCEFCGGRADVRVGFHHMCRARSSRGVPIKRLDVVDAVRCGCANCR